MVTDKFLGIFIIVLFAMQGLVMLFSKGSIRLQKPEGGYTAFLNIASSKLFVDNY